MSDRTSLTITDERRRLEDKLRAKIGEELPDQQFRAPLYDMALRNLLDLIDAHEEFEGDPKVAKHFSTSVVRPKYRTWLKLRRP